MHQPAFLSKDTISYTKALANPTPNFLEGLLEWISASVQGPIESARDPDRKRELEALKKSAEDDPFGADAKVWSATSDAYEQFRKANRAKALSAIGSGNLYFGLWYPIGIAVMTLVIGTLFLKETRNVDITR